MPQHHNEEVFNNEPTPQEVAAQLRKPEGDFGLIVADNLNQSNTHITDYVYSTMQVQDHQHILEIGFGNGKLMDRLLQKANNLFLAGIDFSDTMVQEARTHHAKNIEQGCVEIKHGSVDEIPYDDNTFDKICHINTLYFWQDPLACAKETLRVLKAGGSIYTGIRPEAQMILLPFTQYGFTTYDEQRAVQLFLDAGFSQVIAHTQDDPLLHFNGKELNFQSICIVATK